MDDELLFELLHLPGAMYHVRLWPTVVVCGVLFGVISGGILAATDAYHLLLYDDTAMFFVWPLMVGVWFLAGFVPGRRTTSEFAGAAAAVIAVVLGVLLAVAFDQWLIHATITQWLAHLDANLPPTAANVTADQAYGAELNGMVVSVIVLPPIGAMIGAFGSLLSVGSHLHEIDRSETIRKKTLDMSR